MMSPDESPARARMTAITAGIVALIVYGSLFPFRFHGHALPEGPFRALLSTSFRSDRGDVISNVLLYLPLGFFATLSLRRGPVALRALIGAIAGLALSVGIECVQFYDLGRVPSMADVGANGCGALLGALAATAF